jgi:murein L,D-transpeptidase YafK
MVFRLRFWPWLGAVIAAVALGRGPAAEAGVKDEAPIPAATLALMAARGTSASAPILIRAYKKEAELEVWKRAKNGRFVHLKTFPICRWSGQLGPKARQGDRQTPEGFYSVGPKQMNPNSAYYLSFDTGYPNAYDRAQGGTGAFLMVHGTCSSAGCYAMTDQGIAEIYAIAREAFKGGQAAFQFQAYPFRMTAQNMARYRSDPNIGFWRQLKEGSDRLEATGDEPAVGVAGARYVFAPSKDPAKEALVKARRAEEDARIAALVAEGSVAAVRTTYADGGQHPSFAALLRRGTPVGEVSRPEALAFAGREVVITPARPKQLACKGAACRPQFADATSAIPQLAKAAVTVLSAPATLAVAPLPEPAFSLFAPAAPAGLTAPAPPDAMIAGSMRILPAGLRRKDG